MGGKSSEVTVGYKYYLGVHAVLCQAPVDGISEIRFGDRVGWQGLAQDGQISVNRPDLFGGQSREGGVAGFIDVEGGDAAQAANDYLSTYLRPDQLMPAFRGVVGLIFRQFYWGNNPYIKPIEVKTHNIFNTYGQWLPGLAPIGGEFTFNNTAVHIALDQSDSMNGTSNTNLRAATKSFLDSMAGYVGTSVRIQPFNGSALSAYQATNLGASEITAAKAFIDGMAAPTGSTEYDSGINGASSFFAAAEAAIGEIESVDYVPAASGGESSGVGDQGVSNAMRRVIVFISDGVATGTSDDDAASAIAAIPGNVEVFGIGLGTAGDLATIDNTPQDGVPVITSAADEITGILSGAFNSFTDLNPAHILRDVLIAPTSDGSGDTSEIGDTFATVAQTLFDEGFGLSFFWQRPSQKDEFRQLVEEHIAGSVYRDRETGQWEIKLIRPDYDVGTLFTFVGTTIVEWMEYERPQQHELPNSITVVYTRRDNGETASVTVHNVAAVQVTGRVVNEKRVFEGITRPELANKVAQRELISKTQPLAKGAIRVSYAPTTLNLGSPFILDEPRLGINEMVCRVIEIEEGDLEDTSVVIRFVEDVFASDPAQDSFASGDEGEFDDGSPQPASVTFFEEASYFDQAILRGQTAADDALTIDPGLGNWQMTADRPTGQHTGADIVRYDYPNWIDVSSSALMPVWVLDADLSRAADDTTFTCAVTGREYEIAAGQLIQIGTERIRVDSIVIASGIATFTVGRGCLDTVPQAHAAYSYVMAWSGYIGTDGVDYTDAETVTARILPRTPQGRLPIGSAEDETVTFDSRAFRPLPVGNLKMDGVFLPSGIQSGTVTLTWAHRDRLTQTTLSIADHADGNIGPEDGVEYFLVKRLIDDDGSGETVSHTEEIPLSPPQVLTVDVDLGDAGFSAYAGADTIAMELGILTKRDSPAYENWQTPFIRFETAFAQEGSSGSSVISGPSGNQSAIVKTVDETRTSTTTFADDAELFSETLEANTSYLVKAHLRWAADAGPDIKFTFGRTGLSDASIYWQPAEEVRAPVFDANTWGDPEIAAGAGDTTVRHSALLGVLRTGSNSGSIALQWAGQGLFVADTKVLAGSHLIIEKAT